jgi:hypothetical protein
MWRHNPKEHFLPTSLCGVTTQKNNIVIFTTVRTSNLKQEGSSNVGSYFRITAGGGQKVEKQGMD